MNFQGQLAAEYVAKAAAATSAGIAGWTWLATANDVLQLVATVVGIVAGVYAIVWHKARIENLKKKVEDVHKVVVPAEPKEDRYVRDGEDVHR
jgi:hypothetical protein